MRTVYKEEKQGRRSVFQKIIVDDDGSSVLERTVTIPLFYREKDDFTYILLYDDNMNLNKRAYNYLNFTMQEKPITTRRAAATALRFLYCFLGLTNYDIYHLGEAEINELVRFLRGINSNPAAFASKTLRIGETVNGYLSYYRTFFADQHIGCDALFRSHTVSTKEIDFFGFSNDVVRKRYDKNVRETGTVNREVPRYISPEDFQKLYNLAVQNKDKVTAVLMHLMYGYGLRPGEALGLTLEDIQEIEREYSLVPMVILRNRMSDARDQFAKGLPHVRSAAEYSSSTYTKARWKIEVTYEMYDQIMDYVNEVHSEIIESRPENYKEGIADRVDSYNPELEQNHYVFLNRYGKRLSLQTLNNHLKEYFKEVGIPLDVEVRENNLAHRFRHGFAMFHARFRKNPVQALELKGMMRHKDLKSTMIYYNPTPEDELEMRTEAQNELYAMLPELKKGVTYLD